MNLLCANVSALSSLWKRWKYFLCDKKKKFMQEMWNVGTTTAMYKEKKDKKKRIRKKKTKRTEPNMWAKENVQKANEKWAMTTCINYN